MTGKDQSTDKVITMLTDSLEKVIHEHEHIVRTLYDLRLLRLEKKGLKDKLADLEAQIAKIDEQLAELKTDIEDQSS